MDHNYRIAFVAVALIAVGGLALGESALPTTLLTDGDAVRRAFRDVVASARPWTVRVRVDKQPAALGIIVREDGFILTKGSQILSQNPVATSPTVADDAPAAAPKIICKLADRQELEATIVGYQTEYDLIVLKVAATKLPVVNWNNTEPAVGTWVATPGQNVSPEGVGVISVRARKIPHVPGVIGVRLSSGAGYPAIEQIFENGPAAVSGLELGDLVVEINGVEVEGREQMVESIRSQQPGDIIDLLVERAGEELKIRLKLSAPFGDMLSRIGEQNEMGGELSQRRGDFPSALQHDTVIKPEECGGAIVGLDGRAVGINIARAGRTESFAIPASVAQKIAAEIILGKAPSESELIQTVVHIKDR